MPRSVLVTFTLVVAWVAIAVAADLQDDTRRAYESYSAEVTQAFLERIRRGTSANRRPSTENMPRDGEIVTSPAHEDGIIDVPGGLVHHWLSSTFIDGVSLRDALEVSYAYNDYQSIYKPVLSSRLLSREGDVYRVLMRVKESGGGLSAIVDVRARVQYFYPDSRSAYSIATSEEIREIRNAGTSSEKSLSPGHDSGYLWRAATFTHFVARDRGVVIESEALGLSRQFPPLLSWVMEPVARRVGRNSVDRSLQEFIQAVKARTSTQAKGR
ncbi:MAG TPA: hypothetical protein VGF24_27770 [Vicinamibacterales bacterium]|jgi:hypothetical protein